LGNNLHLHLLGPPTVQWQDKALGISRRSVRALLYYLAARATPVPRGQLCLLFWPDIPESSARRNLTRLLTHLRMELPEPSVLVVEEDLITLDQGQYWCDVGEFRRLVEGITPGRDDLEGAVQLYRDPFLSGFYLTDCNEFEDWLSQERSELEVLYLHALDSLVDEYTDTQDFERAIQAARRYLETDDLAEEIHRKLIWLCGRTGERAKALRQYEQCVAMLERELGTDPLPETTAVYRAVLEGKPLTAHDEGKRGPQPPWVGQLRLDIPLVGRSHILSNLEKTFAGVKTGSSKIILVSGEPGIGKTRLLHSLISRCQHQAVVLFGSGEYGEMSLPYHPLVEALHSAPSLCPSSLAPAWLSEVSRLLPEISQLKPDLPPPASLRGEEARIRLFDAICKDISSLKAEYGPLLLCLDNLHWFDGTSLDWLVYFCHQFLAKSTQILLIATYRSEDAAKFGELRGSLNRFGLLDEIQLEGLSQKNILELLNAVLADLPRRDALASRLREATGGNPFFILEILRTLQEENRLTGVLDQLVEMPLPDSVREAVSRRLGRLGSRARQVLEAGAVLGGSFQFNSVRATAGRNEMETANALDTLVSCQLLVKEGNEFQFSHDLVCKATAAAISPMRFTLLHSRAGRALERFEPESAPAIAYHYQISGAWDKALKYTRRAAENAEALFAWQEAIALYARMLEMVEQVDPEHTQPDMLDMCGVIYGKLILLDHNLGNQTEQGERIQQLEQLVALSQNKPLELVLLMLRARYLHLNGHYQEALEAAQGGEELALELKDFGAHARLLAQDGLILYFLGQPDQALVKLEAARDLVDKDGDLELRANVLARLAFIKCLFGKYQEALDCHIEARMCYQQLGNAYFAAQQLTEIGDICASLARFEESRQALNEILDLAHKTSLRYDEAHTLVAMGWLHMCQGDYTAAVQVYGEALEILYQIQNPHLTVVTEIELGTAQYHLGNYAQSLTWLEKGLASAQKIKFRLRAAEARILMAMVDIARDRIEAVRGSVDEGLAGAREVHSAELTIAGLLVTASIERRTGNLALALTYAEEALEIAREIDVLAFEMWARSEAGLILLAQDQFDAAYEHTARAVELIPQAHQGWIRAEQVRQAHESVLSALDSER
jgi:DNA-binding SARP family transcriptional activator/predicted ATPase